MQTMGADGSMEQTQPLQSQIQMSSAFFGRLPRFFTFCCYAAACRQGFLVRYGRWTYKSRPMGELTSCCSNSSQHLPATRIPTVYFDAMPGSRRSNAVASSSTTRAPRAMRRS